MSLNVLLFTLTKLKCGIYEETENAGKVAEHHKFDVGRSTFRKQEAQQIYEGDGTPAEQHEDQHCVQEVVVCEIHVQLAELEHALEHSIQ